MDLRKNLNVLPSNGVVLTPTASAPLSLLDNLDGVQHHICQKFNRGLECRVCSLHHICSICEHAGHGAHSCNLGVLRGSCSNASELPTVTDGLAFKARSQHAYNRPPPLILKHPHHTAQAHIRVAQKKDRRSDIWQRWELQSPRYLAYRHKARTKKSGTKEDVWPDHVEEAFQIGTIILYVS